MEISLLFLPLVATFLLLTDFKDPVNRWGSLALLLISLGGLYSLTAHFFDSIMLEVVNSNLTRLLNYFLVLTLLKTPLCLFPAAMILFAFHYYHSGGSRNQPQKPFLIYWLLIPIAIMYLIPLDPLDFPSWRRFLITTDFWALPSMTLVYYFLFKSLICHDWRFGPDKPLTVITIAVFTSLYLLAVYILPLQGYEIFKFNPHFVIGFLGLLSFFAVKYGFLGFKVSVGNISLDNAIKTVGSGVLVINYNIKDKLLEIAASAKEIITASGHNRSSLAQNTKTILAATEEISNVVERLHQYLDQVSINPTPQNLRELVNQAIAFFERQIEAQKLQVRNNLPQEVMIRGDRLYLVETLKNIFRNSLEAMQDGGKLDIGCLHTKENITLLIADSGAGIVAKDLPHVMEPFYTTKDPGRHFGLGLPYCYYIMQQHGGLLEIESNENTGTTVFMKFPVPK